MVNIKHLGKCKEDLRNINCLKIYERFSLHSFDILCKSNCLLVSKRLRNQFRGQNHIVITIKWCKFIFLRKHQTYNLSTYCAVFNQLGGGGGGVWWRCRHKPMSFNPFLKYNCASSFSANNSYRNEQQIRIEYVITVFKLIK